MGSPSVAHFRCARRGRRDGVPALDDSTDYEPQGRTGRVVPVPERHHQAHSRHLRAPWPSRTQNRGGRSSTERLASTRAEGSSVSAVLPSVPQPSATPTGPQRCTGYAGMPATSRPDPHRRARSPTRDVCDTCRSISYCSRPACPGSVPRPRRASARPPALAADPVPHAGARPRSGSSSAVSRSWRRAVPVAPCELVRALGTMTRNHHVHQVRCSPAQVVDGFPELIPRPSPTPAPTTAGRISQIVVSSWWSPFLAPAALSRESALMRPVSMPTRASSCSPHRRAGPPAVLRRGRRRTRRRPGHSPR